jgi:hypothetical protein
MKFLSPPSFAALALACSGALAGTVDVVLVDPARFGDAGNTASDQRENLQILSSHLRNLGQRRLPANQALKVEVLDVDLAGTVLPTRRDGSLLRTVRGRADIPRLHLRYALETDGRTVQRGDEWITDLDYTRGISTYRNSQPLYYEKRMLDTWFAERFAQGPLPGG